ncbi:MAG: S8 family serine peptidase [Fimbriimonas sp.]
MMRWIVAAFAAVSSLGVAQADPGKLFQRPLPGIPTGKKNETIPGYLKVKFRPSVAARIQAETASSVATASTDNVTFASRMRDTGWTLWRYPTILTYEAAKKQFAGNPEVLYIEPLNKIYPLWTEPNDPDWTYTEDSETYILSFAEDPPTFRRLWHFDDINAVEGWTTWPNKWYTSADKPVAAPLIAVIDTGCDMNHPDFKNAGGTSTNSAQGGQLSISYSKQFVLGEINPTGSTNDTHGHGTHVAGLALASGNNGAFSGTVNQGTLGTGYACRGMILRVFGDDGSGSDWDAVGAMLEATAKKAAVINMSLGTENFSLIFQDAVTSAFQQGTLVIAAGNEDGAGGGDLGPIYPAACSGALGVSANGPGQIPATTYSGTGSYVDIAAPGGDVIQPDEFSQIIQFVYSTSMRTGGSMEQLSAAGLVYPPYTRNYSYLAGTSMACPIVSGAAGNYFASKNWGAGYWRNLLTYQALEQSADGVMGAPYGGWEYYQGYGSLNMGALMGGYSTRTSQGGGIEGLVYADGTPIANARVAAKRRGGTFTYVTTSNQHGMYRYDVMPPGVYDVTATVFGKKKVKVAEVIAGCDVPGTDFWTGTYTGDETGPIASQLQVVGSGASFVKIKHWGYDPESGLDWMKYRIGTTSGGSEVRADTEIAQKNNVVTLTGLSLTPGQTYYFRMAYKNGGDKSASKIVSFVVP